MVPMLRSPPDTGTAARPVPGQAGTWPADDDCTGTHTPLPWCRARAGAVGPSWSMISHGRVSAGGRPVDDTSRSADIGPRR